ncbi:DUF4232 domain-containing protein [Pseudonocardia endophytica]|uniref:Uncharacterized protein DUF4232 n=1 Tax=Pseudonocardia endophytica TaxID=401976 RepID=A0A4R1HT27_PSEEN|nr:DUF4232 domain-containing protein [Pseudonocardia endophytica]TCK23019.1 uncharacterized protein DUF4232 [Pseudonocardia endophytica]
MTCTGRTLAGIAAAALAVVALAGCGSDGPEWPNGGGASSTAAAPPETTAPPTETSAPSSPVAGAEPTRDGTGSGGGQGSGGQGGGAAATRCTTPELKASLGKAEGAAGSVHQELVLTNTSGRTCTLRGFPGVSYTQGSGLFQLGPSAAMVGPRGGDVRLAPGGSAGADLKLTNVQNYDAAACRPAPSNGLRVYPPGDTASLIVVRKGTGCAGTPPGDQLEIATLRAR